MAKREAQARSLSSGGWFRPVFSAPDERSAQEETPAVEEAEDEVVPSKGRDRLYTDIGGAIIGLGGAAALLNFVLLK